MRNTPNQLRLAPPATPPIHLRYLLFNALAAALSILLLAPATRGGALPALLPLWQAAWPGLLIAGAITAIRYCFWLLDCKLVSNCNQAALAHCLREEDRRQERLRVTHSFLLGPACVSPDDRQALLAARRQAPTPFAGVLRVPQNPQQDPGYREPEPATPADSAEEEDEREWMDEDDGLMLAEEDAEALSLAEEEDEEEDNDAEARPTFDPPAPPQPEPAAAFLANRLAEAVAPWFQQLDKLPRRVSWAGDMAHWPLFRQTLSTLGVQLDEQPYPIADADEIDQILDDLYRKDHPKNRHLLLGMTVPTPDIDAEADAPPKAEAAFAIAVTYQGMLPKICRPAQTDVSDDVALAERNGRNPPAPVAYVQIQRQPAPPLAERHWQQDPLDLTPYWGDTGPLAPWITLLSALDLAEHKQCPIGWAAEQQGRLWSGIVHPASQK